MSHCECKVACFVSISSRPDQADIPGQMTIEWVAPASAASLVSSMVVAAEPPECQRRLVGVPTRHTSGTNKHGLILEAVAVQSLSCGNNGGFSLWLREVRSCTVSDASKNRSLGCSPSPFVPSRTIPSPAFASLTTCLANASWSIDSSALKGVVRGTEGPLAHFLLEIPLADIFRVCLCGLRWKRGGVKCLTGLE